MTDASAPTPLVERTFGHAQLKLLVDRVVAAVLRPGRSQFYLVAGPSGVGKTKLGEILENRLAWEFREELEADAQVVPVVRVEAPPAIGSRFSHRDLILGILGALGDPAVDRLVGADLLDGSVRTHIRPGRQGTNELLRILMGRMKQARRVQVLIIDEAQHIGVAPSLKQLRADLDVIKGLANQTGVCIVLLGTYELDEFWRASGQLSRRMPTYHFPRYHWDQPRERLEFERVAREMLDCIDGLDEATISASIEPCYERSLGCVGDLRDWLVRAEAEFRSGGLAWPTCLARTGVSDDRAEAMLDQMLEHEVQLQRTNRRRAALRRKLGLDTAAESTQPSTAPRRRPRVGRRNPTRDRAA